jgi:hypothetical protein
LLIAAAIGTANGIAGLHQPAGSNAGRGVLLLTLIVTAVGSFSLASSVMSASSQRVPLGLLATGATYGGAMAGHRAGPVSAAVMGLALLGLAHTAHTEIAFVRRLPTQTTAWSWRVTLAVVTAAAALDAAIALVAGGGKPRPGVPSTLSVAAGCAAVTALVAVVTALADGASLPELRTVVSRVRKSPL